MLDLATFFSRYVALRTAVDAAVARVAERYPLAVRCGKGCADCCHALFDLTLIEALYLQRAARERIQAGAWERLLERANRADRQAYKIKRKAFAEQQQGVSTNEVLEQVASQRVRCPLLDEGDCCLLYDSRPITCRVYGVPTAIGGKGHTCGRSGFEPGEPYPTVQLDALQEKLLLLSAELAKAIGSRYPRLHEMLVPVSMALLTEYDAVYLGVEGAAQQEEGRGSKDDAEKGEGGGW
jgi:Fe-S-cluster containining protein